MSHKDLTAFMVVKSGNAHLALIRAKEMLTFGDLVLCAQEMRCAQDHIGAITGKITSDDILGKIFSTFCIGK